MTAAYEVGSSIASAQRSSEASFTIAQPIAKNAFGRSTRLLDKIVGLEVDVARHQIVEAYEDYLATVLIAYHTWNEDYENLQIGRSSYQENKKLLDNMEERRKQKIALPIDVNKITVQVLAKQETLVELEKQYQDSFNVVRRMTRSAGSEELVPEPPAAQALSPDGFEAAFARFKEESRTFDILRKLEERSSLAVARDADDLLPSINLLVGYEVSGEDYDVRRADDLLYAGISLVWPFLDQVQRAEYEVSKISADKTKLNTTNTYFRLYTQLANLYLQIERELKLRELADEKMTLARSIVKDEGENYAFGKATLNDLIQAVNVLDNNRFSKILHDARHAKLMVEWLRLTDQLISRSEIRGLDRRE